MIMSIPILKFDHIFVLPVRRRKLVKQLAAAPFIFRAFSVSFCFYCIFPQFRK